MYLRLVLFLMLISLGTTVAVSQVISVSGKVKDAETGDPVPFANVIFKGTQIGTTTSFDGDFSLTSKQKYDSLLVSYVGYEPAVVKLNAGKQVF